jgi:hypothetical protein
MGNAGIYIPPGLSTQSKSSSRVPCAPLFLHRIPIKEKVFEIDELLAYLSLLPRPLAPIRDSCSPRDKEWLSHVQGRGRKHSMGIDIAPHYYYSSKLRNVWVQDALKEEEKKSTKTKKN